MVIHYDELDCFLYTHLRVGLERNKILKGIGEKRKNERAGKASSVRPLGIPKIKIEKKKKTGTSQLVQAHVTT